jgi:hypothetical protein
MQEQPVESKVVRKLPTSKPNNPIYTKQTDGSTPKYYKLKPKKS